MNPNSYTFIDVETPNPSNDKVCSLAIIHIQDGVIEFEGYYLINPEASFDERNMAVHGIKAADVMGKPTFAQVWPEIESYLVGAVMVAHNAQFDLRVISKTLLYYDLPIPEFRYFCTCEKAKRHLPARSYRLPDLACELNIELSGHHHALHDTKACMSLFVWLTRQYGLLPGDVQAYLFDETLKANEIVLQKAMNELYGILYGIGIDQLIRLEEHKAIETWMQEYKAYRRQEHFEECYHLLDQILEDRVITEKEFKQLMQWIKTHESSSLFSSLTLEMQVLYGILKGIIGDGLIRQEEADALKSWMEQHSGLSGNYPFNKIYEALVQILRDGRITAEEESALLSLIEGYVNPKIAADMEESIDLNGKVCCLTGTFIRGTKAELERLIVQRGGSCVPGLTKAVHYLIVGGEGSTNWAYGNFGGKIKKALEMKDKGSCIEIISETAL
ncbi:exonuclease domain-containing protein [Paenibacillus apii]|uniref:exonuclease domain-containing protein n=1 Tax=Paenibacillus apii TaxID=1850370 RepID=UPI00143A62DB|nr:exonuclease domain-containing protein [Paenibacillus apii]NJJ39559.1 hypothetical protein [Paenibacillus apii]